MKITVKLALPLVLSAIVFAASPALAQRQMENLGRGVVVLHSATSQAYLSWRLLVTDPSDVGFNIYRSANGAAGVKLNTGVITNTTDYLDTGANFTITNAWYVRPVISGVEQAPSATYGLAANSPVRQYVSLPLVNPGPFGPYDVKFAWFGDFDGDGEYDYLVDRLSTTGGNNQFLQAYKRDGTFLWQMNMGFNSTNTANAYEPDAAAISVGDKDNVTVYDLDGDGKAEVIVRTANGTIFADNSTLITNNNTVQFLSILDGMTGVEKARAVVPNLYFADGPLNCHMGVIYWDGIHPSILLDGENRVGSGNFQRQSVTWDYRNGQLTQRWIRGDVPGENQSEGHQLRIADVNHDGKDDLVQIASVVTDNGTNGVLIYDTELVHGDRYHVSDIDPERPGLEMFAIQQNNSTLLATSLQDMQSGALYKKWYSSSVTDVGRGTTFDMTPSHRGLEMYSTQPGIFNSKGVQIYANNIWPPEAIWWDGDVLRELEDGAGSGALSPVINKFNPTSGDTDRIYTLYDEDGGVHQAYGGRAALWGDLFGDWREEFMVVANDYNSVRIYTTKIAATNRIYCLMQNPMYRVQNTYKGYYQASYVDYYLGHDMPATPIPPVSNAQLVWRGNAGNVWDENITASWFTNNLWISNTTPTSFTSGKSVLFDLTGSNNTSIAITGNLSPSDVRIHSPKPYTFDSSAGNLTGTMKLTKAGAGSLTLNGTNTFTGATLVGEGSLIVNGSLPSSPVTVRGGVWLDGRLGGTGVLGSTVRFEEGAGFSAGSGANSPGTLTVVSNVTFTGRTLSDFDLSDNPLGVNDLVNITGNLTLTGTNTLVIRKLNATLPPGVYPLINYSGALSGNLNNLAVSGLPGVPLALTNPPGQIALVIKSYRAPATINWTGGSGGNAWDLLATSNFLNGATKDQFVPGDTVRFDSIGTSNLTANLVGDLVAASVIVDSTANYTIAGAGNIAGGTSLSKSNTGTLTISALNNSYTGKTTIAGGTVVVSELDAAGNPSPFGAANSSPTNFLMFGSPTLRVTGESYTDRGMTFNAGTNTIEVLNSSDQVTLGGLLTGAGSFKKIGSGALAITRSNNFSGNSTISGGTVSFGGDSANQYGLGIGPGGNGNTTITLDNGSLRMFNNSGSYNSTYWNLAITTNGTSSLYADDRCFLYGTLTGAGTLNYYTYYVRAELAGNWSAFTGRINVIADDDGGDFRINNSSGYGNAAINLAPLVYAYHMSGSAVAIGELSGAAGSVLSGSTAWTVGAKNTDATFSGDITSGSITKVGTGSWTVNGLNITYSGGTTVSAGTLLMNANASAATGAVTVNSSGTLGGAGTLGGVTTVSGKLAPGNNTIGTLVFNANLTLNAGSTTTIEINKSAGTKDLVDGNATVTYGGTLVVTNLAGAFALNDSFKIFDAATYAGAFNAFSLPSLNVGMAWSTASLITNGTINVVSNGVVPPAPSAPTNLVALAASFSQINLTWSDTSTNEDGFYIERSTDGVNFNQIASVGTGIAAYSDTGLNAGATFYYRVRAGNVGGFSPYSNIASTSTFPPVIWRGDGGGNVWDVSTTANWRSNGAVAVFNNGVAVLFDESGSNNTAVNLSTTLSPGALTVNASKSYTLGGNGPIAGAMTLTKAGSGTLTISTTNTFSGGLAISNGMVAMGNIGANDAGFGSGNITFYGGTLRFNGYGGNVGTGWGGCTNTLDVPVGQTGTLQLPPRWGYSYPFTSALIGGGTLNLTVDYIRDYFSGNWSAFSGLINVSPRSGTGDFRIDNSFGYVNAAFYLNNNVNFYNVFANNQTIDIGELGGSSGAYIGAGSLATTGPTWRIGAKNTSSTYAGTLADSGTTSLTKIGTGTLTLSGNNTYSGVTTISGGTLRFGAGGTTGSLPTNNIVNNATLTFNRANNLSDSGIISGTGSVVQDGDGVVTLTRNHTYSGATLINSGTLALTGTGSISNSSIINIASGATLDVSGRTSGDMTLTSGKTLSGGGAVDGNFILASGAKLTPGNSLGTLTFSNNLTLLAGSTTTLEISKPPLAGDRVNVIGTLNLGGTLVVTNVGAGALAAGDSFQILSAQLLSGSFSGKVLPPLGANLYWDTNSFAVDGKLTVVSTIASTPTNISYSVSSANIVLSWPASHLGWKLQAQTNSINTGLSATWFDVAGSTGTNLLYLPLNPANPSVFYRLSSP